MARMSAAKRIELGTFMVLRWSEAGMADDRSVRFVRDMVDRLNSGRGLTRKQRLWFDDAVLSSPPKPQNEELVSRLREYAAMEGMEDAAQPLTDFAFKLSKGWTLSERQTQFMYKLMDRAENIKHNGRWEPSPSERASIELGCALGQRIFSSTHQYTHPGHAKAIRTCSEWLAGEAEFCDEWSARKVMSLYKTDRRAMEEAASRWPLGALVTVKGFVNALGQTAGLVVEGPIVVNGKPKMVLFISGETVTVPLSFIKKQRRLKKKTA